MVQRTVQGEIGPVTVTAEVEERTLVPTFSDLGSGTQLSSLASDLFNFTFYQGATFKIRLWDHANQVYSGDLTPDDFDSPTVDAVSSTITDLLYTNGAGDALTIRFTANAILRRVEVTVPTAKVVSQARKTVGEILVTFQIPHSEGSYLNINAQKVLAVKNPATTTLTTATDRGFRNSRGGTTGVFSGAQNGIGVLDYIHYYETNLNGLMICCTDQVGYGFSIEIEKQTTHFSWSFVFIPANNKASASEGATWEAPYSFYLWMLRGEAWDGAIAIRDLYRSENYIGMRRGKIRDTWPSSIKNARMWFDVPGGTVTPPTSGDYDWSDAALTYLPRLKEYYGDDASKWVTWFTNWERYGFGNLIPDYAPFNGNLETHLSTIIAAGWKLVAYLNPDKIHVGSAFYAADSAAIDALLMVDPQGQYIGNRSDSTDYDAHMRFSWLDAAILQMKKAITPVIARLNDFAGYYWDTLPGNLHTEDYNSSLPATWRGDGGRSAHPSVRSFAREQLLAKEDYTLVGEFPNSLLFDLWHWVRVTPYSNGATTATARWCSWMFTATWGQYVYWNHYAASAGILAGDSKFPPTFRWFSAWCLVNGTVGRVLSSATEATIVETGDGSSAEERWVYEEPVHAFNKRIFVDAQAELLPYFHGVYMRPTRDGVIQTAYEDGVSASIVAGDTITFLEPTSASIMDCVLYDDANEKIGVVLVNWRSASEEVSATRTIDLSSDDYRPLQGSHNVTLRNPATGVQLKDYGTVYDGVTVTVEIPAGEIRLLVIDQCSGPVTWEEAVPVTPLEDGTTGEIGLAFHEDGIPIAFSNGDGFRLAEEHLLLQSGEPFRFVNGDAFRTLRSQNVFKWAEGGEVNYAESGGGQFDWTER